MGDEETLDSIGLPREAQLVACLVPKHALIMKAATALLDEIPPGDYKSLRVIARPTDSVKLTFLICYLTLGIIHGEDAEAEPWRSVGAFPVAAESRAIDLYIAKEEVKAELRPLLEWSDFARQNYIENAVRLLRDVDHFALGEKLGCGGPMVQEVRRLMAIPQVTSANAARAAASTGKLMEWLEL